MTSADSRRIQQQIPQQQHRQHGPNAIRSRARLLSSSLSFAPLLAAALLSFPLHVAASSAISPRTEVALPLSWSAPQILALTLMLLLMPPMLGTTAMLWRMRHRYPIAGRGALSLLLIQVSVILMVLVSGVFVLVYDGDTACGLSWLVAHLSIDLVTMPYLTRGWTLVVRLEIQSYFEEKQAREQRKLNGSSKEKAEAAAGTAGQGSTDDGTRAAVARVPSDDDPQTPLPGLWYLAHRSLIRPAAIGRMWLSLALIVTVSCVIVGVFDPDAEATQDALWAQGYNSTVVGSAFEPDAFLFGPRCLSSSVKMLQFEAVLVLLILPAAVWMTVKMAQINKRKKQRMEQQRREQEAQQKQQEKQQQNGVQRAVTTVAVAPVVVGVSSLSDLSQHDSDRVQLEFALVCLIVVLGISGYVGLQLFAPHFHSFAMLAAGTALWCVSIVWPIRDGIVISNRVKAMLANGGGGGSSSGNGKSIGDRRLAHHRPYFNLRYLLSRDHTYPVLLSFLQKEFSSENLLFVRESHAFEAAAIKLQNAAATHWQLDAEDYEITIAGGGGGRGNSGGSRTAATAPTQPRTSVVAAPSRMRGMRQASVNMQGATVEEIDDEAESDVVAAADGAALLPGSANLDDAAALAPAASATNRGSRKTLVVRLSSYQLPDQAGPLPSPSLGAQVHPSPSPPSGSPSADATLSGESSSAALAAVSMVRLSPSPFGGNAGTAALSGAGHSPTLRCWNAPSPSSSSPAAAASVVVSAPLSGSEAQSELLRLVAWFARICSEYICASARFQVNLPEEVSRVIVAQCEALSQWAKEMLPADPSSSSSSSPSSAAFPPAPPLLLSSLFRAANREIMSLLEKDSLRRFVLTAAHRQLILAADQAELARIQKQQALASAAQNIGQQLQRMGAAETAVTAATTNAVIAHIPDDAALADDAAAATDAEDL